VILVLDGETFGATDPAPIPLPSMLDDLLSCGSLSPALTALVPNTNRRRDLRCSPAFADFLGLEVMPWIMAEFGIGRTLRARIAGASLGASWRPSVRVGIRPIWKRLVAIRFVLV
jgi:enterochelin esterase-like enzyme